MKNYKITINFIELDCYYDYQPKELPTHDYPGCGAEIQYLEIYVGGIDIRDIIDPKHIEKIENELLLLNQ
jgi:hypothetical protein